MFIFYLTDSSDVYYIYIYVYKHTLRINEQRNILHEIRKRKANWIGHILRRNCLPKQVIEGKIKGEMEVTRKQGRRCKKLLDDLKDRRRYSHLKEEALDRTMWRNRFGGSFGPVVRQNTEWWLYTHDVRIECLVYLWLEFLKVYFISGMRLECLIFFTTFTFTCTVLVRRRLNHLWQLTYYYKNSQLL